MRELFIYCLIRCTTFPLRFLPYSWIRFLGRILGTIGFYCHSDYRKRTLSNLALASSLHLNNRQIKQIAIESFQNLVINCLEYPRLDVETNLSSVIQCENPEVADSLHAKKQGIIFFCAHQANWEVLFLDGTTRMKGVAIGKSIKNKRLYQWIVSIRERNGGKIISPHNAIREGFRSLKKGSFLGIVGDQGMPNSGYSYPFLGRLAWTSTAPALLSYRTGSPVIFAETNRTANGYKIRYADPIWPDLTMPIEKEIVRIMDATLKLLEKSVVQTPAEWLWQHNRWKQQTPNKISKRFRHDCICIIFPSDLEVFEKITLHLPVLREIYPMEFITLLIPDPFKHVLIPITASEKLYYHETKEMFMDDYRFKLVLNFTDNAQLSSYYKKRSAFEVLNFVDLKNLALPHLLPEQMDNLTEILKKALYRSEVTNAS